MEYYMRICIIRGLSIVYDMIPSMRSHSTDHDLYLYGGDVLRVHTVQREVDGLARGHVLDPFRLSDRLAHYDASELHHHVLFLQPGLVSGSDVGHESTRVNGDREGLLGTNEGLIRTDEGLIGINEGVKRY